MIWMNKYSEVQVVAGLERARQTAKYEQDKSKK